MVTHKERILMVARGETTDMLPYVPRIDLWYNANSMSGTLPKKHIGRARDDISRAEGWALHKVVPDYTSTRNPQDTLHRAIGIFSLKETPFRYEFSSNIGIKVKSQNRRTRVEYDTPIGKLSTVTVFTEEMRKAGASISWIEEHALKRSEDCQVLGYLFENLKLAPDFVDFVKWQNEVGEDGIAVAMGGMAASPMHHILKYFMRTTDFYYLYHDNRKKLKALAESVEHYFEQALRIVANSPAEAVVWGANFDDMITYPPLFEREIVPWIRKAADVLGAEGKIVICHCDGENLGLMELIKNSGMHVAESICPYPMTKVRIEEYYQRWSDKVTIFGGVPSNLLLAETTTEEEFETYLDHLFKAIAPGRRFILGVADTTPANAVFDRLVRIGEKAEKDGRLPLEGGTFRPISHAQLATARTKLTPETTEDQVFKVVQDDVFKGNHTGIESHVQEILNKGVHAQDILRHALIPAMEAIGERFKFGSLFIPEVLLSSRAMDQAVSALEAHLASGEKQVKGKVLIGTVKGDLHDIGKNMVAMMLRGVGFEVRDIGVNIGIARFISEVSEYAPDILGLSALLTTTMSEMKKVVDSLVAKGLRNTVKVMVGGAPINEKFAKDIGADCYAPDCGEAIVLAKKLMHDLR
jgi:methylmalonyl-CoA mutase cobalamin-binding domain/chain